MKSLTYISRRSRVGDIAERDILSILSDAMRFNKKKGLTGALLATDYILCQFLEGKKLDLDKAAHEILGDCRQHNVTILSIENYSTRKYSNWHMQYSNMEYNSHEKVLLLADPESFGNKNYSGQMQILLKQNIVNFDTLCP